MLIKRETIEPDPPVVVEHTREVVSEDSGTSLAIAFIFLGVLAVAIIGYFAWWSPNHTDVYVSQPAAQHSGRAETIMTPPPTIVNNPPANSSPIIIHEHESNPPTQGETSGGSNSNSSSGESTSGSSGSGSGNSNENSTSSTSGSQTQGP